jgi:hypothetical protein
MDNDEMTVGNASLAKAVVGASSSPPGTSLLEAYERWKASQAAAPKLGKAADAAADLEARALKKSRKHLGKLLRNGMAPPVACDKAHQRYRLDGGKSGYSVWARRVAGGE